MAEIQIDSNDALALSGATDPVTGVKYPRVGEDPWAEAFYRMVGQMGKSFALSNQLRVYQDDSATLSVGVCPGNVWLSDAAHDYSGELVTGLVNNDSSYIWLEINTGVPAASHGLKSAGWPAGEHLPLAEVVTSGGEVQDVIDQRGLQLWAKRQATRQLAGLMIQVEADADTSVLIDNSGGTSGAGVIAVVDDPSDTPASADALRDDLVANVLPGLRDAIATLAGQVNVLSTELNDLRQKMRDAGVMDAV